MLNGATCVASCSTNEYLSYERLQRNEAERKVRHSSVKSFELNFLGSNSPIEDRFVFGISEHLGTTFVSVIDGHKGSRCSHFLQQNILQFVVSRLYSTAHLKGAHDLNIVMDMNTTISFEFHNDNDRYHHEGLPLLKSSTIEDCLRASFISLDNAISGAALSDVKLLLQGHSFTAEMKERVMRAVEGACAIVAMIQEKDIYIANTGDCRIVLGHKHPNNTWQAIPLSTDQNVHNALEVERVKGAHPQEENTVIMNGRVLGSLMPFRTFGDVDFKWERKYLESIIPVWPNYRTPPYVTAEPVITHHNLQNGDEFVILASDGLWERISNQEAVNVVAQCIKATEHQPSMLTALLGKRKEEYCCKENAATKLLWHALGGTDKQVTELLDLSPGFSRMFRDDITVIVVFFR